MNRDLYIKASSSSEEWQRPSDWLPMPTGITSVNQTFVGLHAVIENSDNYVAFLFTTSAGQYRVDWGDGTVTLHNSNTIAQYQYNFATISNSTLTSRGYKQCMITVTVVSGNLLTCNFQQRFLTSPAQNQAYSTGFLDCILSMPNASSGASITLGGTTVRHTYVERFDIKTIGNVTSCANLFNSFYALKTLPLFDTSNVTSMVSMFSNCSALQSLPLFNTINATNTSSMFNNCLSLNFIPMFNTINTTNMMSMFNGCFSLIIVPLFNTSNVTVMTFMFSNCTNIQTIPLFNTSNVTSMFNIFHSCQSLNSIPALSTASITTTSGSDFGNFAISSNSLNRIQMVFARTVSISNCQLSRDALVEIFNNLVNRSATTSATITITGNWGVTALSAADLLIATNKNWVVVT
jgi:surface protein